MAHDMFPEVTQHLHSPAEENSKPPTFLGHSAIKKIK